MFTFASRPILCLNAPFTRDPLIHAGHVAEFRYHMGEARTARSCERIRRSLYRDHGTLTDLFVARASARTRSYHRHAARLLLPLL